MKEETVWAVSLMCATILLLSLTWSIYLSNIDKRSKIQELVAAGVPPIQARCALLGPISEREICTMATFREVSQ